MPLNDGRQVTPEFVCTYVGAKDGVRCERAPAFGSHYCPRHSGTTVGKVARKRQRLADQLGGQALGLLEAYGVEDRVTILKDVRAVDPGVVLLEEVARAAAVIRWLEARIGEMSEEELMHEPELLRIRERKLSDTPQGESYKVRRTESRTTVSRYWALLQEERKLLVNATTAALRSNIEERKVRLAERGVNVLEAAFTNALLELGLDPHNDRVRAVVGRQLRQAIEAGDGVGGSLFMGVDVEVPEPIVIEGATVERTETVAAPPPPPADF